MQRYSYIGIVMLCLVAYGSCAESVIVDGDHLNGSFESGVLAPWGGGSVVSDDYFAADGAWYAQAVATVSRAEIYQFFPSVTTSMPVFALSFQARNGSPGFSSASGSLSARRQDGSFINAVVTNSSISPLTDVGWSLYTYTFEFTETWDMSQNMKVGISFNDGTPGAVGFADHVVLEQVRERPGLDNIIVHEGTATLTIGNLSAYSTCSVEQCFDLLSNDWSAACSFGITGSQTNWSEELSNDWHGVFYRVKCK